MVRVIHVGGNFFGFMEGKTENLFDKDRLDQGLRGPSRA